MVTAAPPRSDDVVAQAEAALASVGVDPRAALVAADAIVARVPRPRGDSEIRAVVVAERAAGLCLRELSDPAAGDQRMRRAVRLADRHGLQELAAQARMSRAYTLLELGRLRAALATIDRAAGVLDGLDDARLRTVRALVLQRSGREDEALAEYDVALRVLVDHGDVLWECRLRNNRAILLAMRGDTAQALDDLEAVHGSYTAQGRHADAADTLYNLGYLAGTAGDVVTALRRFGEAMEAWGESERAEHAAGHAEVLLQAGLLQDAVDEARRAVAFLDGRGWSALETEARLILAETLLLSADGPSDGAAEQCRRARLLMLREPRAEWTAIAEYVDISDRLRRDEHVPPQLTLTTAESLWSHGSVVHAAALCLQHAEHALARGAVDDAIAVLAPLADGSRSAPALDAEIGQARAMAARLEDRPADADRALAQAWASADARRGLLGATELRAGAGRRGQAIAALGLRWAHEAGSTSLAFTWVERERGALLRHPPAVPPLDGDVATALAQARWAAAEDEGARLAGMPDERAAQARAAAERRLQSVVRRASTPTRPARPASVAQVRRALDGAVFAQLVDLDGELHAHVVDRTRIHHLRMGRTDAASRRVRAVLFDLRRALTDRGSERLEALDGEAARCRTAVLEPLLRFVANGRLVVSPPPSLAGVPWQLLGAGTGIAITVAPSATTWAAAARGDGARRSAVVVAGPGLPSAEQEIRDVAASYVEPMVLSGSEATAMRVLRDAPGRDVLHLAAHGTLRRDNPLFSALTLSDGPLTMYDLERIDPMPDVVTMTACSAGAGSATYGEDVLGLAWAVLHGGSTGVIAPLLPVPDDLTAGFAGALHRHLRAGTAPAEALGQTAEWARASDPAMAAVASAFVAFG